MSSEDHKHLVTTSSLNVGTNINPVTILTESSSSDSYTESVCTAYDNQNTITSRPESGLDICPIKEEPKEASVKFEENKPRVIASLFEGLFWNEILLN